MRFRSDPSTIRGSIAPLVTPFDLDGAIDLAAVARLVQWQLDHGTHGISVGGSTGEPTSQSIDERISVMEAAAEAIDDRVPFLPGTGTARIDETLELTAAAQRVGADAALVVAPYYARPTQAALRDWYSTVAREFPDLPIIVYNVPIRSAVDVTPETIAVRAREHDNLGGG
jgi:4-hydroxy-tetrahydrodipicolinate synthase